MSVWQAREAELDAHEDIERVHVAHIIETLVEQSPVIQQALAADKLMIVGARYPARSRQSRSAELLSVRSATSPTCVGFGESLAIAARNSLSALVMPSSAGAHTASSKASNASETPVDTSAAVMISALPFAEFLTAQPAHPNLTCHSPRVEAMSLGLNILLIFVFRYRFRVLRHRVGMIMVSARLADRTDGAGGCSRRQSRQNRT